MILRDSDAVVDRAHDHGSVLVRRRGWHRHPVGRVEYLDEDIVTPRVIGGRGRTRRREYAVGMNIARVEGNIFLALLPRVGELVGVEGREVVDEVDVQRVAGL